MTDDVETSSLPIKVRVAASFWQRFRGLMLTSHLSPDEGLLLQPCSSVHTCFMRYPIDLVFLDRDSKVLRLARNVVPYRMAWGPPGTDSVLELSPGAIDAIGMQEGDRLPLGSA